MIKLLVLAALSLTVSTSLFAETISFQCLSNDIPGVHKFDAHGIVTVDDFNNVQGVVNIITQKSDSIQSVQTFEEVRVEGYIRHFKAGEVSNAAFDQLVLKTNETYLKTLNLLLDFDEKIASRIMSIDNFSYRSNCKKNVTYHL